MNLKQTMTVMKPVTVTETELISTDVEVDALPAWVSGTHAQGAQVILNNRIYEALTTNSTENPATSEQWLLVSSTNPWRMFDFSGGSTSERAGSITVTITPGQLVNALAFLECECNEIEITMTTPGEGTVYSSVINMINYGVSSPYDYFFASIPRKNSAVALNIPPYRSGTLVITFRYPGSTAKVGNLILGEQKTIGTTLYGTRIGLADYSVRTTNPFGRTTVSPRGYSNLLQFPVVVADNKIAEVRRMMAAFRSLPAVWIGTPSREETIAYGYFTDFYEVIKNGIYAQAMIEVEGLVLES